MGLNTMRDICGINDFALSGLFFLSSLEFTGLRPVFSDSALSGLILVACFYYNALPL